ncbi:AAA domain-containing protein [Candidatus Oscillochloris fontis]|uniref:AAA domain-containing protein n=1 Tax=Candidatus Oscillochloris fontis TaxID=2496868 RepID=UPI00101C54DF|nr:AAA domain-containing protein [Candidatus Oscillochloris fontis]
MTFHVSSLSQDTDRRQCVDAARERWRKNLINLTRNNPLLYYQPLKTSTLEFNNNVDKDVLQTFLSGQSVSLRDLFPTNLHQQVLHKANQISMYAKASQEEKGIETLFLGIGLMTWEASTVGRPPAAPIILQPVQITMAPRKGDAHLQCVGNPRINDVLLYALAHEHGRTAALELQSQGEEEIDSILGYLKTVILRLAPITRGIPGLKTGLQIVLRNFTFQKLGIVNDLLKHADELAAHDLIAAIAGDPVARECIQDSRTPIDAHSLDRRSPDHDFLIRDADSSQQRVIAAVLAGQSGVIQGPPGTGKSQTIANLIATLAANGKRVLFVAEKQAALEVVRRRLHEDKLSHLVLNIHDGSIAHRTILDQFNRSLAEVQQARPVDTRYVHQQFVAHRGYLNDHVRCLHASRLPAELSVYGLRGALQRIPATRTPQTRWRNADLASITLNKALTVRSLLSEASGISALFLGLHPSPWQHARLSNRAIVENAITLVDRLALRRLPQMIEATRQAVAHADLPPPTTVAQILILIDLLPYIAATLTDYERSLYDEDLMTLVERLAPAGEGWFRALWYLVIDGEYLRTYRRTSKYVKRRGFVWPWTIHEAITEVAPYQEQWLATLGQDASVPEQAQLEAVHAALESAAAPEANDDLMLLANVFTKKSLLQRYCRTDQLDTARFHHLQAFLAHLRADEQTPYLMPRVYEIRSMLQHLGVTLLLRELREQQPAPESWVPFFERAWLTSCLEQAHRDDPALITFQGQKHQQVVDEFQQADHDRIQMTAARVRRVHAEHVRDARNTYRDQDILIQAEIQKKRGHLPLRRLVERTSDLLITLCPCWMASPLSVSQFIPADKRYFDVVIFDEASQVVPEDAIAALLRGTTVVVAGDKHQLPPTSFFAGGNTDNNDEDQSAPEQGFESLIDLMSAFLEPWPLLWHYRSRDESLIAFANKHIYENNLITFPAPRHASAVNHVLVQTVSNDNEDSSASEVRKVVALILEHAEQNPTVSLGIITLGITHMQRVQSALDAAIKERRDLDDFFAASKPDPFFIKNLERVQGDERDAIILSLGYTKHRSGRLNYSVFGPLLKSGGERRLNVAITRARQRITVVSSFDHTDMSPGKSQARGVELLREYLAYVAAHGVLLETSHDQGADALDTFESDIYETLTARGLHLQPRFGASEARIAFAVKHPHRTDEYVLAIETDGPAYYAAPTASDRDRLRPLQLRRLNWCYHRIWSLDWYQRREQTIEAALQAYAKALHVADKRYYAAEHVPAPAQEPLPSVGEIEDEEENEPTPPARASRPNILRGLPIGSYVRTELIAVVRWINSDGILRTDEEIMEELRKDLEFKRIGSRMREQFQTAIDMERRSQRQID